MIKSFSEYINEGSIGAITMERSPVSKLNQPDVKTPVSRINMGRGGPGRGNGAPFHWGSTGLSFGANPKKNKKKMSHIDSYKKFAKKETRKIEEEAAQDVLNIPAKFKAESDAINTLKDTIAATEQDLAAKKADLNNKMRELQNKIAAEQQQQNQQQQVAQQPSQPPIQ